MLIGVALGLSVGVIIVLATGLAYLSGMTPGLVPAMRNQNKTFLEALKLIWIGEVVSIGVMEIAMNSADYTVGGMQAGSILAPAFWFGIAVAVPAGFLAAWPINWWLLKRDLKSCH